MKLFALSLFCGLSLIQVVSAQDTDYRYGYDSRKGKIYSQDPSYNQPAYRQPMSREQQSYPQDYRYQDSYTAGKPVWNREGVQTYGCDYQQEQQQPYAQNQQYYSQPAQYNQWNNYNAPRYASEQYDR